MFLDTLNDIPGFKGLVASSSLKAKNSNDF